MFSQRWLLMITKPCTSTSLPRAKRHCIAQLLHPADIMASALYPSQSITNFAVLITGATLVHSTCVWCS